MNLKDYLEKNEISAQDFAKKINVTRAMVYRYSMPYNDEERVIPSYKVMMRIIKATEYQVSINSFYYDELIAVRQQQKKQKRRSYEELTRNSQVGKAE